MLQHFQKQDDGMNKEERKAAVKELQKRLSAQQQLIRDAGLPVVVLVEGWAAAGKGSLINELISEIDPRFSSVFTLDRALQGAHRYPFLYPFFCGLPEKGKFLFMDSGWMETVVRRYLGGEMDREEYERCVTSVQRFERQLRDNGYLLIKLFVHVSRKEQKERLQELRRNKDTAWRVTEADLQQNEDYEKFAEAYSAFMARTGEFSPWHVLDGSGQKRLLCESFRLITQTVDAALAAGVYNGAPFEADFAMTAPPRLAEADLSASMDDATYESERKALQKKIARLHNVIYRKRIPVVICYEGWDASGKGGNIRRVAKPLDPRGFDVYPIAAPEPHELARHYLWRFWTRLPRSGHVAIFDRSWYGRVMVERLEKLCTENDWRRAYNEINEFEEELLNAGTVLLKFWIHIDPETQLQRFTERQNTPEKQWKITEEDWRNREKWPQYEEAVSQMLEKTSTRGAPWHIIESVDKKYARIKVLRLVADALEAAAEEH